MIDSQTYEMFYDFKLPEDGSTFILPEHKKTGLRLEKIKDHKRYYSWA